MLHIVLLILKILLYTILILLGILILALLLVMFVPVKFKAYAEKKENIICKIKASWLGFVFCFKACYDENGFLYRLKSFGGTLVSNEQGFEKEKPDNNKNIKTKKKGKDKSKSKKGITNEKVGENESVKDISYSDDIDMNKQFVLDDSDFEEVKESIFTHIGKIFDKYVLTIKDKMEGFLHRLKNLKKKANQYKKFLESRTTKQAWQVTKTYLIKLLKHIKPKKINGSVIYGTGDPASTGEQLGYISFLFPIFGDNVDITPDFSRKIFEGDIFIKGRVRVYNILYYACKIYFNKYVKRTIAHFKKISGGSK